MKELIYIGTILFSSFIFCNAQNPQISGGSAIKFHNKLDDVKTANDINEILNSIDEKRFEAFVISESLQLVNKKCGGIADTFNAKPWTKADFDNNGYTDLLVIGKDYTHSVIVISDVGKDNFIMKDLARKFFQDCTIPVVQNDGEQPVITYYSWGKPTLAKTLIYKFGDFIESNNSPGTYRIEKIEYRTSGCFGACPSFGLTIDSNRKAIYKPIYFNNRKKGKYTGKIKTPQFDELAKLLNYIDFLNLQDNYFVSWTDDQTSYLTITYNGGNIKNMKDYGLIGTFGLSRVYEILFNL